MPEVENYADTDTGVGDIERWVDVRPDVHVQKVDHMTMDQPVGEISGNSAAEQTKTNLRSAIPQPERASPDENRDQRRAGERSQKDALPSKQAPGRAGVPDVDEVKHISNNTYRVGLSVSPKGKMRTDPRFGELIQRENQNRNDQKKPIGSDAPRKRKFR
jgi:hypothetical protein